MGLSRWLLLADAPARRGTDPTGGYTRTTTPESSRLPLVGCINGAANMRSDAADSRADIPSLEIGTERDQ